jgi:Domain of unknown function (DUF4145)
MPKLRTFICPHCDQPASSEVRGVAVWNGRNDDGDPVDLPTEWALVQCNRCALPSVQIREDVGGPGGFDDDEPGIYYPSPHRISPSVPDALRREWAEARTCFNSKAYTACLVMVRRTLEGTCRDQGVSKRTLHRSLEELKAQGLMDGMLAEWADALRLAGNRGAHFTGETVSREDAEDALDFAEALLDHIYVLRQRFADFQRRMAEERGH